METFAFAWPQMTPGDGVATAAGACPVQHVGNGATTVTAGAHAQSGNRGPDQGLDLKDSPSAHCRAGPGPYPNNSKCVTHGQNRPKASIRA
jgi:hypothetical protein